MVFNPCGRMNEVTREQLHAYLDDAPLDRDVGSVAAVAGQPPAGCCAAATDVNAQKKAPASNARRADEVVMLDFLPG